MRVGFGKVRTVSRFELHGQVTRARYRQQACVREGVPRQTAHRQLRGIA